MKKILFGAAAILAMVMASCNGNNNTEKVIENSTPEVSASTPDTIAQMEAAEAAAEQTRQEYMRQSSIENAEEFQRVVKALEKFPEDRRDIDRFLTGLGFEGGMKKSRKTEWLDDYDVELEVEKYRYSLTLGEYKITYSMDFEDSIAFGNSTEKFTIEGDKDALERFYRVMRKKLINKEVSKKGNTVIIKEGWA